MVIHVVWIKSLERLGNAAAPLVGEFLPFVRSGDPRRSGKTMKVEEESGGSAVRG